MKQIAMLWVWVVAVMLFAVPVNGGVISGSVTDYDTGEKLTGVTITVKGTSQEVVTGTDGSFNLTGGTAINDIRISTGASLPQFSFDRNSQSLVWNAMVPEKVALFGTDGRPMHVRNDRGRTVLPRLADGMYILHIQAQGTRTISKVMVTGSLMSVSSPAPAKRGVQAKAAAATVTLEAESMTLNKYVVENHANGRSLIKVDPSLPIGTTGSATAKFSGLSGLYTLSFTAVPENDGQPQVKLYVNGTKVMDEKYPTGSSYYRPDQDKYIYTVPNITINTGDEIKIEGTSVGTASSGAFARVDKIDFEDANKVTLVFEKSGYRNKEVPAEFDGAALNVKMVKHQTGGFPTFESTGPSGTLKDYPGDFKVTASGAVIENLNVGGQIQVEADNVTIRNCKAKSIKTYGRKNTVVEDCAMGWMGKDNFTMRRCRMITDSRDLVRLSGPNVVIEDCFFHVTGPEIDGTHVDIVQEYPIGSATNTTIKHNTMLLDLPQTGCLNGPAGAHVENNLFAGGSYTIYGKKNMKLINNHFSNRFFEKCGKWGIYHKNGTPAECYGNIWHETGKPVSCP